MKWSYPIPCLERAQGYLDLGLLDDAWSQLAFLSAEQRDSPEALHIMATLLMKQKRWDEALIVSFRICELLPSKSGGFIHAAYCLHELGRTREACEILRSGPDCLQREPLFHYNLSCYSVSLGSFDEACASLERSFELDERLAGIAEHDPDLVPLWATLRC
ncbi:MAG: putative Zn-dependent protease [Verrucomicrobia bacterium]|jgi:predicted Zn-dependent protease|nr:MAG: putative Zn-dependent protease [Verrucomicrobiota bacterium]